MILKVALQMIREMNQEQSAAKPSITAGIEIEFETDPERYEQAFQTVENIVKQAGFECRRSSIETHPTDWTVGTDGGARKNKMNVEMRSPILSWPKERNRLSKLLGLIQTELNRKDSVLSAQANTGIHVHVGRPGLNDDPLSKVAMATSAGGDIMSMGHGKNIQRYAKPTSDFEDDLQRKLGNLVFGKTDDVWMMRKEISATVPASKLSAALARMTRNYAVNVRNDKRHAVELRSLSTIELQKNGGEAILNLIDSTANTLSPATNRIVLRNASGTTIMEVERVGEMLKVTCRHSEKS